MKTEERSRHTVWMEDTVWQRVQEHYKSDGCSTQNEFIAKAILFYCGYLISTEQIPVFFVESKCHATWPKFAKVRTESCGDSARELT